MSETRSMHTVPRGYSQLSLIRRRKLLVYAQPGLTLVPQGGMMDSWRWRPLVVKLKHQQKVKGRAGKSVLR